jgi:hypothetical protein
VSAFNKDFPLDFGTTVVPHPHIRAMCPAHRNIRTSPVFCVWLPIAACGCPRNAATALCSVLTCEQASTGLPFRVTSHPVVLTSFIAKLIGRWPKMQVKLSPCLVKYHIVTTRGGGSDSVASHIICVSTRLRWVVTELRWEIVTVFGFPVVSCRTSCILHWYLWSITNCRGSSDNEVFCCNNKAECDFSYAGTKL